MIEVHNLTKAYGPRTAIADVSFDVQKGEILGFLGPNGAGKTTTMRILTGFMPPTAGTATVAGYDVFEQSLEVRKRIGYMPESVPLYPEMSVWDYLNFMAELRHLTDREDHVEHVMDAVQITDRADQLIGKLSKGFRQRVGLAQALVHDPEVLILDEPTVGLDPKQIIEVRELIKGLAGERTVILSTHILPEVQQICSRVLIINKGHIVAEDTPERLTAALQGTERVHLQLRSPTEQTAELLGRIENVLNVRPLDGGHFEVECALGMDRREEIARLAVNRDWGLLELRPVRLSLEDIFLQLTTEDSDEKIEEAVG
ncbi:MAG: ABC transporter ATP-binding protein [Chloroflexi bacterium]|nr:ABC transporter ATP-binding protein [Chloroflexota bacterium]MBI3733341.1 ABC transporter ATP-binding protein [Chloroflexota bacterium]